MNRVVFNKSLFIFRRDLRLDDNSALLSALNASREVLPCFIFDPRQVEKHRYFSANALQFMIASLLELAGELRARGGKLYFFFGKAEDVAAALIKKEGIDALYVNADYTPFSRGRDEALSIVAAARGARFFSMADALLVDPLELRKKGGGVYSIFTPFFKAASKLQVQRPKKNHFTNYRRGAAAIREIENPAEYLPPRNPAIFRKGGRKEGLAILSSIGRLKGYEEERNLPALSGTSGLSAHNKFGTVSIREVYHCAAKKLGGGHSWLRQLYWRDFFSHVAYHFPHVFEGAFHRKYDALAWRNDSRRFKAWREGRTGFPLVDAGMRELNATGFMHNRVRMVTASFLVKDLHIDWRRGERYFAQRLVDYDPAVNNGNWQWAASTGCDAQPYFRIFNPRLQQKRFDAECVYIKKWVPELRDFSAREIHHWGEGGGSKAGYPRPIVDHLEEKEIAEEMYEECC